MEEKLGPLFHPSTSLSSIILFLSFFSLFFTSHGRRVAIETVWKPTKFLESRQQATSFRVSLSPPRQYTRYTVNNIGPDGGHWNVFSGPAFKRRKWKPVQIAAMKARSLQNVGECRERGYCALSAIVQGWYWWAHLIGCVTHGYV